MDLPVDFLNKLDVTNLLAILSMFWMFKIHLDKKFDKIDVRFEKVDSRFDKLEEKVTDIDRRLCRLEGAFASKDCCMIKEDKHLRRAD